MKPGSYGQESTFRNTLRKSKTALHVETKEKRTCVSVRLRTLCSPDRRGEVAGGHVNP